MTVNFNTNAPAPAPREGWGGVPRRWSDEDILSAVELLRTRGYAAFPADSKERAARDAKSFARAVMTSRYWPTLVGHDYPAFISGAPREVDGWWNAYLIVKESYWNGRCESDRHGNPLRKTKKTLEGSRA